jgi:hypothetical protein
MDKIINTINSLLQSLDFTLSITERAIEITSDDDIYKISAIIVSNIEQLDFVNSQIVFKFIHSTTKRFSICSVQTLRELYIRAIA